jgi:hypothetical protein
MKLELDDAALRGLFAESLLNALTEDGRKDLLKQALVHITEPLTERNLSYNHPDRGKSRLQLAFNEALDRYVRAEVRKALEEDPETKQAVESLVRSMTKEVLQHTYMDKILATAISDALDNMYSKARGL